MSFEFCYRFPVEKSAQNTLILDWFFIGKIELFVKHRLLNILDVQWLRYCFKSPVLRDTVYCHELDKLKSDPDICKLSSKVIAGCQRGHIDSADLFALENEMYTGQIADEIICNYYDSFIYSINHVDRDEWIKSNTHP